MKLARPDVFHPRLVLAGCRGHVAGDGDDAGLVAALKHRGLHARWLAWDDPETTRADLVILRATHDYAARFDEFLTWTTGVTNLLNAPAVVAWNADRRYLGDLAARGVPTVAGEVVAPGERVRLPRTGGVFVGPALGTGSRHCADGPAAAAYLAELHKAGRSALVQPGAAAAETALVFLGGGPSHAFIGLDHAEPDFEVWDVGLAALAAAAEQVGIDAAELLCARARVVEDPPRLLELQLVEPSLGWRQLDPDSRELGQRRFALAVESACERLGLGPFRQPFSHRGP
jgi:hypothetical protein